jgi:outer membrane lipoprotein SlyB
MLRFALLLVLVLTASAVHAQDRAPMRTGALQLAFDARLTTSVQAAPRVSVAAESRWKAGAVAGGVLGGVVGFVLGYGMDNVINEGRMSVGENAVAGTLIGAVGGALLGAGIGSLIRR